jgi:hypothetical protein
VKIGVKYDLEILHVLLEKKTHLLKIIVLIYTELFLVLTEKYFTVNTGAQSLCSRNLYTTPFLSYPSQVTLMKLIKLKRTQTVCTEREREREKEKERKNRENFFSRKNELPPK